MPSARLSTVQTQEEAVPDLSQPLRFSLSLGRLDNRKSIDILSLRVSGHAQFTSYFTADATLALKMPTRHVSASGTTSDLERGR
jgi:hypothetical protein